MVSLGYRQSQGYHTLFINHSQNGKLNILLVYVNDMIITGVDEIEKKNFEGEIDNSILDEGSWEAEVLVWDNGCSRHDIFISQRKYILDLLKETGKLGCKTTKVPIEQNHRIGNDEENPKVENNIKDLWEKSFIYHTLG